MADAPAAVAAATPAAAPPPTPSGKAAPAFDVRLALAKNLGTPGQPGAAAVTAAGGNIDADPAADDAAADAGADADPVDPAEGDATDGEGDAAADGELTPEAQLEAVTKAFESGDIEAMAKALKKAGAQVAGPVKRAFRAFQRRQMRADERDRKADARDKNFDAARSRAQQEIAEDSRRVSQQERGLIQRYSWADQLARAWDDEDMLAVSKALEKGCKGASLATITQKLASGKTGKTPEERQLAEDRRKFEEEKANESKKKTQQEDQKQLAQKRESAVARVGETLKAHPYLQTQGADGKPALDQEALAEVFSEYEKSWNGEKFTKTARGCADELQEKLLARAKARGLAPAAPAAGGKKPVPSGKGNKPAVARTVKEPPRTAGLARGSALDMETTRANRLAQARRLTEMQRRGVR